MLANDSCSYDVTEPLVTGDDLPIKPMDAADASTLDLAEPESDDDDDVKQLDTIAALLKNNMCYLVPISRIPCHFAQPIWAYELPHRREIVPGAVFQEKPTSGFWKSFNGYDCTQG